MQIRQTHKIRAPIRPPAPPGTLLLFALFALPACTPSTSTPPLFTQLSPEHTGVAFTNDLPNDPAFNIINYLYYYDGGGAAAGDVNNDGLVDLYFTASVGPNRLYLNRGGFTFEDVTEQAGVAGTAGWTKGVTMADVDGDGWLDIYVSAVHYKHVEGRNMLFINGGAADGQAPTFTEQAARYGLDHQGLSTQASFFDYDRDGDLDVYLVNHSTHDVGTIGGTYFREWRHPQAGDKLLRNEGGRFIDVSAEAGIYGSFLGYGLSVAVSDLNLDGWPDLYVSNDFHENDYLYFNNGSAGPGQAPTFTEAVYTAMGHTSRSSMGNDVGDVNNDGRPDVVVADMLPEREEIVQTAAGAEGYDVYQIKLNRGYHHQFARNTLQLNLGNERFIDVGYYAGIEATDWSWAALLGDLDNDGYQDLFVTNGIYRRPNDLDYLDFAASSAVQLALMRDSLAARLPLIERMPQVPLSNYAFRNNGDLTFTDRAAAWGLGAPGFSNGAAYADLDNDGDLDLVVNNLHAPAGIYRNHADSLLDHHYLTVVLEGEGANTGGIGARVVLKYGGMVQMREQVPTRGWESAVDPRLHFGLGTATTVDTLTVVWPDGRMQRLAGVSADRFLTLRQPDAGDTYPGPEPRPEPLFEDVTDGLGLDYRHEENAFIDFTREPLMPHTLSREGPALAVGDVDGDGRDDLFAGGAKWQAARLLVQQPDGRFRPTNAPLWQADRLDEDVDAAFFDADGDGDLDLYVVSAGNEFWGEHAALRDRLYRNDGRGGFTRAEGALPEMYTHGCCVVPADFDADGDVDLFVGGRGVARSYGAVPPSYLLENDGAGVFSDATGTRAPALATAGMVTDAAWTDYDGDDDLDLIVVGEWMPVRVFAQEGGRLVEQTEAAGLGGVRGSWTAVAAEDMDADGDADLILGNLGLNSYLQASPEQPVRLYLGDFDRNGKPDQVLTHVRRGNRVLFASRDELIRQMPSLANRYPTHADFVGTRAEDLLTDEQRASAEVLEINTFTSMFAANRGDGTFTLHPLPTEAQYAPIYAILTDDVDLDGHRDLVLAGNFGGVPPRRGRYDASYGVLLKGDGRGGFRAVPPVVSGLVLEGEGRALRRLRRADGTRLLLAARNDDRLQVLRLPAP